MINEAIEDDGSFRKSEFYKIIGEDFIKLAFQFAHQADPNAALYPDIMEFEKSLQAYGELGKVMITELDLSVLPSPWGNAGAEISDNYEYDDEMNPFPNGLPEKVQQQFSERYLEFFSLFLKHQDKISRVALWGVNDGNSWKNNWPVKGRTNYPLLFDRENKAKPVVSDIIELAIKN